MTTLSDITTMKIGDLKQLIYNCVQIALEDETSEFFKTCEELNRIRGALDPRELRSEHVKWHRKDNWLLVKREFIDYDAIDIKVPHLVKLEFDAGLYRAYMTVRAHPAPDGDIQDLFVLIGAFWAPEHQPPTGPIKVR